MVLEIIRESVREDSTQQVFLTLNVFIDEGEQYTYGGIRFEGNTIFDDEELMAQMRARSGAIFNGTQIDADIQNVSTLYFANGYIFNTIIPNEERDEQERIISYKVDIIERPRAHLENIVIRGNTKTQDHVIMRELNFEVGEVFSATKVRQGVLNLFNLQFFANIVPETPQGSAEGLMDLILNVEETNTADIRFGLAFGGVAEVPISLQVQWRERNFLGLGQTMSAGLSLSTEQQDISFEFIEPWVLGERWQVGVNVTLGRLLVNDVRQDILAPIFADDDPDAVPDPYTGAYVFNRDENYNSVDYDAGTYFPGVPDTSQINVLDLVTDYEFAGGAARAPIPEEYLIEYIQWNARVGVSTNYRIVTPIGNISLGTGLSLALIFVEYDRNEYRPFNTTTRNNWNRLVLVNQWTLNASIDSRDLFYSPSSGYFISQRIVFTGGFLFGERHYIRSDSGAEVFFTLFDLPVTDAWNWKMVLGLSSTFSAVFPHFFVPEPFDGRQQPVATTSDLLSINGLFNARGWPIRVDGEALWNSWIELRMPIEERIVWFDAFFEAAAIWQDLSDIGQLGIENMLFSFGAGLRLNIPQFPLRFYIAKRFRIVNDSVEFQTGTPVQ